MSDSIYNRIFSGMDLIVLDAFYILLIGEALKIFKDMQIIRNLTIVFMILGAIYLNFMVLKYLITGRYNER